jgi:serine protease
MPARRFSLTRAVSALTVTALLCGPVAATPALATSDPLLEPEVVAKAATTAEPASQPADRIIVKFKDAARGNVAERDKAYGRAAEDAGVTVKELRSTASGATVVQATEKLSSEEAAEAAAALEAQPSVEYAEVDTFMRPTGEIRLGPPDDPGLPLQWSMDEQTAGMNVSGAWPRSKGAGTVVAVIDTGITSHSDLNANLVPGYDFISDPNIARDGNGRDSNNTDAGDTCDGAPSSWHGTHVAGTIGAVAYNGRGVVGVAYETKIQPIRALGACGGYLSDISDALTWAVGGSVYGTPFNSNPADVVNMSLGGSASQCSATFQTALNYAASRNATVIAAAGNENSPVSGTIPANCD